MPQPPLPVISSQRLAIVCLVTFVACYGPPSGTYFAEGRIPLRSEFSGMGSDERVAAMINNAARQVGLSSRLQVVASCDSEASCQQCLLHNQERLGHEACVFEGIRDFILQGRSMTHSDSSVWSVAGGLQRVEWLIQRIRLMRQARCRRHGRYCSVRSGFHDGVVASVSGSPCQDFSTLGTMSGEEGLGFLLWAIW